MKKPVSNIQASIHDRLNNQAKAQGQPYNEIFQYYLIERFLYRLSISPYSDQFILKGAMAINLLDAAFPRATRDIDFLGIKDVSLSSLENAIKAICAITVEDDGLEFIPESVVSSPIKINDKYPGIRFNFMVHFGKSVHSMQIDVGVADKIFPAARKIKFTTHIGHKNFMLKTYATEQMIAEKVQTLVQKGQLNSRMKDIFDIWWIASSNQIKGQTLSKSIKTVFINRQTPIPQELAFFKTDYYSQRQQIAWQSLLKKMRSDMNFPDLPAVLDQLKQFLIPVVYSIYQGARFDLTWDPEQEWAWK